MNRKKINRSGTHAVPRHGKPGWNPPTGNPGKPLLKQLLLFYGINLNNVQLNIIWSYHQLFIRFNRECDLSRLFSFQSIVLKHYADCLLIKRFLNPPLPSPLLDIGSGAGFPGIMIKILYPEMDIVLAEPRPKRAAFLRRVIDEIGFKGIQVFPHKVTSKSYTNPVKGCITRAFGAMQTTLPRVQNALEKGGRFFFMKGPAVEEELLRFSEPEYEIEKQFHYDIPNSTQKRSLIILRRVTPRVNDSYHHPPTPRRDDS